MMLDPKCTFLAPVLAVAILLGISCSPSSEPTPEPTFDIPSAVSTAVAEALAGQATPPTYTPRPIQTKVVPTYTPRPRPTISASTPTADLSIQSDTPTLTAEPLPTVPCGPDCVEQYEPIIPNIKWILEPSVTHDGIFHLEAEIRERYRFHLEPLTERGQASEADN